ncbi:MAG: VOC family protein [Candidatus Levyibacteriota bacterium]
MEDHKAPLEKGELVHMQKIVPFLWFVDNAQEVVAFYTSIFADSRIVHADKLVSTFELAGLEFMALNGGDYQHPNPSISSFVSCETEEQINTLWEKLLPDGKVLIPFDTYPFSKKYGWLSDKYGVSWQLNLTGDKQKIAPAFMFTGDKAGKAEEAIRFYTSLFENSRINALVHYEPGEGDKEEFLKFASFVLSGQDFVAMDSSLPHDFTFSEGVSLFVRCQDQKEVDRFWEELSAQPDAEQCGWLKDKFGVSWQIIPNVLMELMADPDREKADRVMQAMLKMKKIEVKGLQEAYRGGADNNG